MLELVLFWFGFAFVVAIAASARGRNGAGWFLLAALISPLLAGLFLIAVPNLKRDAQHKALIKTIAQPSPRAFEPDGVYGGIPYRVEPSGAVSAMMPGGFVKFRSVEQFEAAARGETVRDHIDPELALRYPQTFGDIRYRVERNGKVYAWGRRGEQVYKNWRQFFDANSA